MRQSFFQISNDDRNCVVRVTDVSQAGFESFSSTLPMSKNDFLEYAGLVDGACQPPEITDEIANESYLKFKEKYCIRLNPQQERAVQSVEGNVLLLAVPGSGKTTVLVDRLGYMVCERKIDPTGILAITFSKNAADEMKSRFSSIFGRNFGEKIDFRTINSLSLQIYEQYCKDTKQRPRTLIKSRDQKNLFIQLCREFYPNEYASDNNRIKLQNTVSYARNMMLSEEEIAKIDRDYPKFGSMFLKYSKSLKERNMMNFDDQMIFAYQILTHETGQAALWQNRYHYICVDEAQDMSRIQHEIIRILSRGNNLFMVGDEDQSIYKFRAAYPKALLNFRADYKNPYILHMERNYRSTPQIVEKAQSFISENKGWYEKNMTSERPDGKPVELIQVKSREAQYYYALESAKSTTTETAFLYRDNDSSIALIDLFLGAGVPFRMKKPEMNFFGTAAVRDVIAYLTLTVNDRDTNAFRQICNKGILYLKKEQIDRVVRNCRGGKLSVYDAAESQMKYLPNHDRDRAKNFRRIMERLSGKIPKILSNIY